MVKVSKDDINDPLHKNCCGSSGSIYLMAVDVVVVAVVVVVLVEIVT